MEPSVTITGSLALEIGRAVAAGLPAEARLDLLRGMLTAEERAAVMRELLREGALLTEEEAAALCHGWTLSGFRRMAKRENLPYVKGPHMARRTYRFVEVAAMLERLQIWPNRKPTTLAFAA